MYKNMWLNFI